MHTVYASAKNRLLILDKGAAKVQTVEPVTGGVICQVKQYTHITENGIRWSLNSATVPLGGEEPQKKSARPFALRNTVLGQQTGGDFVCQSPLPPRAGSKDQQCTVLYAMCQG